MVWELAPIVGAARQFGEGSKAADKSGIASRAKSLLVLFFRKELLS
jgi:hypothetical protein